MRSTPISARTWARLAVSFALAIAACNGDDAVPPMPDPDGGCEALTEAPLGCTPTFDPPDYATVYDEIIERRCGSNATGCHGSDAPSGLVLTEPETAHAALLGETDGPVYVVAGHPECSEIIRRVQSSDPRVRMPLSPAEPLEPGLICALRHWIAEGAEGP